MKKRLLIIITITTIFITGCYSYSDMNRVYFATFAIHDRENEGNFNLYGEFFTSDRGDSEQAGIVTRIVLKGSGKNSNEAFSMIQGAATYPIRYDIVRAMGFTEDMAKNGIQNSLDFIARDQNITNKIFLFITDADPIEFLNIEMSDEKFLGIWLEDTFIFQKDASNIISIRSNNYLNERLKGSRISVLPIIQIVKMPTEDRLNISGAAIMRDDKMVDRLEAKEIPLYKILFSKESKLTGAFSIEYPHTNTEVVLSVLDINLNSKIEPIDGELTLTYDIKMNCSVKSIFGELDLEKEYVREEIIKAAEEDSNKRCENFYKKFQEKGIDILDIKLEVDRNYPNMQIDDDIFKSVNIKVDTSIELDGSQNITSSF